MTRKLKRFSVWKYSGFVILQFILLLVGIRLGLPKVWTQHVSAGAGAFILVFLGMHFLNGFAEWIFHRYLLHAIPIPWMGRFARNHRNHHSLTSIRLHYQSQSQKRIILNQYPIVSCAQYEDSTFPHWALVAFWGVFSPFFIGLQLLLPAWPILIGGYAALTWSLGCYEIFHHIEHLPYEWWKHHVEHPRLGGFWKRVYGFHHMHHAVICCNEAISGFFGLPIADWVFGTYLQPKELMLSGRVATAQDFALPKPRRFVRWLDRRVKRRESKRLRRQYSLSA